MVQHMQTISAGDPVFHKKKLNKDLSHLPLAQGVVHTWGMYGSRDIMTMGNRSE